MEQVKDEPLTDKEKQTIRDHGLAGAYKVAIDRDMKKNPDKYKHITEKPNPWFEKVRKSWNR